MSSIYWQNNVFNTWWRLHHFVQTHQYVMSCAYIERTRRIFIVSASYGVLISVYVCSTNHLYDSIERFIRVMLMFICVYVNSIWNWIHFLRHNVTNLKCTENENEATVIYWLTGDDSSGIFSALFCCCKFLCRTNAS